MYAKYTVADRAMKGSYIVVRDGVVRGFSDNGTVIALSNFGFMLDGGYAENRELIKVAALKGVDQLIKTTKLKWS